MLRLHFEEVGRQKKSWHLDASDWDALTDRKIMASIRNSGALMSRDIEYTLCADSGAGSVYAGMRPVGRLRLETI